MARKKKQAVDDSVFDTPARTIKDVDIVEEIENMFVPYAHYTIADRAIPKVEDGLKPSQRRILWTMQEAGFTSKKPYVKSARVTGLVIGQYHPHGDAACYGTMANLVKPYIQQIPLVAGKGSFGFRAGDEESAARYTEAKMAPISDTFMSDIKYDAVDMQPNYDERLQEPIVLPVPFPLLPINGASGIAVGFATNIAPHNPDEIIDATIALVQNPKMTVDELMEIVPGPDFPTGCDIIGIDGIRSAYETGKGIIKQRAKYRIEEESRGRHVIKFYETPYNVSPKKIIDDINNLRANGTLTGVTEVMDLMDKNNPVCIAIYVKAGVSAQAVAELCLEKCSKTLYCSFGINQTALLNNVPRVFPMLGMLNEFIKFRRNVILRRTKKQIEKAMHDKSLQEALASIILDIDKVISIVRNADTNTQVYTRLKKEFKLNDEQAKYIGDMRLIQLKKTDKLEVDKKIRALDKELKRLNAIIKTKASLNKQLILELEEARPMISKPRQSRIIKKTVAQFDASQKDVVPTTSTGEPTTMNVSGPTTVFLSADGKLCHDPKKKHPHVQKIDTDLNDTTLLIFDDGDSLRLKVHEIPTKFDIVSKKCVGFTTIGKNEELRSDARMAMATSDGKVKVLDCSTLTKTLECPAMSLSGKAKVLVARPVFDDAQFVFITSAPNLLKFPVSSVNAQGRTSAGVAGIKLTSEATVVSAFVCSDHDQVVTVTEASIKVSALSDFPGKGRGTLGINCHKFRKGEMKVVKAYIGAEPQVSGIDALPAPVKRDAPGTAIDGLSKVKFFEK